MSDMSAGRVGRQRGSVACFAIASETSPVLDKLKENSGVKWIWDMFNMIMSLNVRWRAK